MFSTRMFDLNPAGMSSPRANVASMERTSACLPQSYCSTCPGEDEQAYYSMADVMSFQPGWIASTWGLNHPDGVMFFC